MIKIWYYIKINVYFILAEFVFHRHGESIFIKILIYQIEYAAKYNTYTWEVMSIT